jgi:hypothetical protein
MSTLYFYIGGLSMLVAPPIVVGQIRRAWQGSAEALRLQAWQLRQLVARDR